MKMTQVDWISKSTQRGYYYRVPGKGNPKQPVQHPDHADRTHRSMVCKMPITSRITSRRRSAMHISIR